MPGCTCLDTTAPRMQIVVYRLLAASPRLRIERGRYRASSSALLTRGKNLLVARLYLPPRFDLAGGRPGRGQGDPRVTLRPGPRLHNERGPRRTPRLTPFSRV